MHLQRMLKMSRCLYTGRTYAQNVDQKENDKLSKMDFFEFTLGLN